MFAGIPMSCSPRVACHTVQHTARPRLALVLCLQSRFGEALGVLATLCSAWIGVNSGTHKRSAANVRGDSTQTSVRKANKMVARTGWPKSSWAYCVEPLLSSSGIWGLGGNSTLQDSINGGSSGLDGQFFHHRKPSVYVDV